MDLIEVELRFMVHGNEKINGEVPYGKFISKKGKEKNENYKMEKKRDEEILIKKNNTKEINQNF